MNKMSDMDEMLKIGRDFADEFADEYIPDDVSYQLILAKEDVGGCLTTDASLKVNIMSALGVFFESLKLISSDEEREDITQLIIKQVALYLKNNHTFLTKTGEGGDA